MPCEPLHATRTVPSGGAGKPNVKFVLPAVSIVAGRPLISKSDASTPVTGSLKLTVICVKLVTLPGAGLTLEITGGVETPTVTFTGVEELRPATLSVARA